MDADGAQPTVDPDQARPYVIDMLDALRRQREAYQINQPRYMLLARKYGLSDAEIADAIGMSEGGVRRALNRAAGTPGMDLDVENGGAA
jgi:DNA-directed RNA polymerase specialized sigma24 family protein